MASQHVQLTRDMSFAITLQYIGYFRDDNKMAVLTFFFFFLHFQAAFILQNLLVIPMPTEIIKDYTWQVGNFKQLST